jgi:hypothetical protein
MMKWAGKLLHSGFSIRYSLPAASGDIFLGNSEAGREEGEDILTPVMHWVVIVL